MARRKRPRLTLTGPGRPPCASANMTRLERQRHRHCAAAWRDSWKLVTKAAAHGNVPLHD